MRVTQEEVFEFMDYLVERVKEQNKDLDRRIAQFHDQRCETPSPECRKVVTRAIKEAVLTAIAEEFMEKRVVDGIESYVLDLTTNSPLKKNEKEEEGGTGFYL